MITKIDDEVIDRLMAGEKIIYTYKTKEEISYDKDIHVFDMGNYQIGFEEIDMSKIKYKLEFFLTRGKLEWENDEN